MAAPKQSFDLDDEFERYGPVDDVDAFIDSQFKFATEDEEEMYGSSRDETQTIRSKMGTQADGCASTSSTLDSFDLSFASDTLINIPLSPPEEPHIPLCSRCRESMESEGADGWARTKVMTASESLEKTKGCVGGSEIETTSDPRNAEVTEMQLADISEDVGTCWRELGPKLEIAASKIHNLDEECNNNWEKANALLLTWKQQEGRCATVARLANYLESIKRKSIAEKLLGIRDIQLPIVSTASQGVIISLTVECTLNADPDRELMLCTDVRGNKYILKACHNSVGDWNSEEIQKNRQFLETVATATQEMGKGAEQRRQESLKRISTEVQQLRRQLKRIKLDSCDTESDFESVFSDPSESKESSKEPQDDANKVSHQDAVNVLQSCKEQRTFCQGIYDALIKLIGEIGQPRDDNFKCIKELYEFTKELKDREKTFFSKIQQLCGQKPHLDEPQVIQVKELEKWSRTQEAQIEGVENLLSSLFTPRQNQNQLKRRSAPVLGWGKSSNAFGRRRSKTDASKNPKSQSLSELPDDSRKNDISGPVCVRRVCLMDSEKK